MKINDMLLELNGGYCNSKCLWCYTQYDVMDKSICGYMCIDDFKRFVDLNNKIPPIIPFNKGEALIHPPFNEIIEYGLGNRCYFKKLHSNFSMNLTDRHLNNLLSFKGISVNIGGVTDETHYKNMGTSLKQVSNNLNRFCELKKANNIKTDLVVKMVVNKNNLNESKLLKTFAWNIDHSIRGRIDPIAFMISNSNDQEKLMSFYDNNYDDTLLSSGRCHDRISFKEGNIVIESLKKPDYCPHFKFTVRFNGDVQLCCRNTGVDGNVGNAFHTSIKGILRSDIFQDSYQRLKKKKYVNYCKSCS